MRRLGALAAVIVLVATAAFYAAVHRVSGMWLDVALNPEISASLEKSLDDQKLLRRLDSEHGEAYRRRFEATRTLLARLGVIGMNREAMLRRFDALAVGLFAIVAAAIATFVVMRHRRSQDDERRRFAERLASWQEAARRQVHEIRGPLTAARMEAQRLGELARQDGSTAELMHTAASLVEEIDRLGGFAREFSSFTRVAEPVLQSIPLQRLVEDFCQTFAGAWPNVELRSVFTEKRAVVCADRDLIRQVLVNLCTNSAQAVDGRGTVTLSVVRHGTGPALEVRDTGGGIPAALRPRIFDPYVTTRRIGSGMGLGLAISRKIMLDHGGDLELIESSTEGTTFRMTFGESKCP